jgi:large subunit ribosomal protein L18
MNKLIANKNRRKKRIRKDINGTADVPRLTVYRSNKHIFAQIIDDVKATTLVAASDIKNKKKMVKKESAKLVGKEVGAAALKKGIKKVVFDRNGNMYHGRVKELADGARESGLIF